MNAAADRNSLFFMCSVFASSMHSTEHNVPFPIISVFSARLKLLTCCWSSRLSPFCHHFTSPSYFAAFPTFQEVSHKASSCKSGNSNVTSFNWVAGTFLPFSLFQSRDKNLFLSSAFFYPHVQQKVTILFHSLSCMWKSSGPGDKIGNFTGSTERLKEELWGLTVIQKMPF